MSDWIKCDKCNKITEADSSGEKRYKIGLDGFDGYSTFHVCEKCLHSFYKDYLGWVWNCDEEQYVQQESEDKRMNWGISENESEKERLKKEVNDYFQDLNAVGKIDYICHNELYDACMPILEECYDRMEKERMQKGVRLK